MREDGIIRHLAEIAETSDKKERERKRKALMAMISEYPSKTKMRAERRRLKEFMRQHRGEWLSGYDIAKTTRVSARTLVSASYGFLPFLRQRHGVFGHYYTYDPHPSTLFFVTIAAAIAIAVELLVIFVW